MHRFPIDAQLLADARRITTGANVHDINVAVAYYKNEVEIYNTSGKPTTGYCVKLLEDVLRMLVYKKARKQ
jgi:hypothetical protein